MRRGSSCCCSSSSSSSSGSGSGIRRYSLGIRKVFVVIRSYSLSFAGIRKVSKEFVVVRRYSYVSYVFVGRYS